MLSCPVSVAKFLPVLTSQSLIVSSRLADARSAPSGLKVTVWIVSVCPQRVIGSTSAGRPVERKRVTKLTVMRIPTGRDIISLQTTFREPVATTQFQYKSDHCNRWVFL